MSFNTIIYNYTKHKSKPWIFCRLSQPKVAREFVDLLPMGSWNSSFPAPGLQENAQELTQRLERVASEATSGGGWVGIFLGWIKVMKFV